MSDKSLKLEEISKGIALCSEPDYSGKKALALKISDKFLGKDNLESATNNPVRGWGRIDGPGAQPADTTLRRAFQIRAIEIHKKSGDTQGAINYAEELGDKEMATLHDGGTKETIGRRFSGMTLGRINKALKGMPKGKYTF